MRITNSIIGRVSTAQINQSRAEIARTQEQASTGLRINRPSDDPVGYQDAQHLKGSIGQTEQFLRTLDASRIRLGATENALADTADIISQAEITALEAANGSNGPETFEILKIEIEALFEELLDRTNSQTAEGAYVFSGRASDRQAFVQTGDFVSGSPPPTAAFNGDASRIEVEIDRDVQIPVAFDGASVFEGSANAFEALRTLWTGLDQNDPEIVRDSISELGASHDQLLAARTEIGNSGATADRIEASLEGRREELTGRLSVTEDADAFEVFSRLVGQQTTLQASLQVSSSLLSQTLLDFI